MARRLCLFAAVLILFASAVYAQCPGTGDAALPQSPSDQNFNVGQNVQFTWSASPVSGVTYDVIAFQNINSPVFVCQNQTGTNCTNSFNAAGQWTWFVKTKKTSCSDVASGTKPFTIGCLSGTPSIQSPSNNATNVPVNTTLTWSAVSGADSYDIYLSESACGVNGQLASSNTTSFTPPTLSAGTTYGWRVVAKKSGCPSPASSCGLFTTAGCNPPGSFDLRSPNNLTTGGTPSLSWNGASGAAKYQVHIGTTNPPATSTNDPIVTGTSYTPTTSLSPGTYYWNVDAYPSCATTNNPNATRSTSTYTFTVRSCPTGSATLTSPGNNVSLPSTSPVTFNWTAVANSLSYDVMLSADNGTTFTSAGNSQTSTLTKSLGTGSYVWYVRTNFDVTCNSTNSQASHFTVASSNCPTAAPTLSSPANGAANVSLPVTFNWSSVSGATGYKLFAAANGTTTLLASTTDATRFITSNVPTGTVTWWVVALFDNCPSTESPKFTFTTASNNCPTTAPALVSPANNAANVDNPVKFDWNPVAGATSYRVLVSIDGATSAAIGSTTETELAATVPGSSIEWWVEASFDNCPSVASSHFKFTTTACPPNPGTPSITSPADGANNLTSPVTLQWSAVAGAKAYVVIVSLNGSTAVPISVTTSTQLSAPLPAGTYSWVVEAKFGDDCPPTVSPRATFTVTSGKACSANSAPTPVSPPNGATNVSSPVTFSWSTVPGALGYNLYAGTDASQTLIGTTTDTSLTRSVPTGTTAWSVEALFVGCDPVRSVTSHFTLGANACDQTISRVAPADGATVTSPVTFQWTPVSGATTYRVWLAMDNGSAAIAARTTNTSAQIQVPSGNGAWYVEAVLANCTVISSTGRFTVPKAQNCDGHTAPALVAPLANLTADKITFQWSAVNGAVSYRLWLAVNNQPFAEIALTKDTSVTRELPAATYSWFVDALFENCPPVASAHATFVLENTTPRCSNSAPSLVSPPDKSPNVSSPVTFLWSSVANAVQYRLFTARDGGAPHLVTATGDTSFTQPLPPGEYAWSVEAVFRNCPSTQSPVSTFTVPRNQSCRNEKPHLVSPADGTKDLISPVTLSWDPLTGAAGYAVFARHGDGVPTVIGTTTSETSMAHTFPDGKIEWWVLAYVTGCDPQESTHFTFTVTTQNNCNHHKPTLRAPEDGESVLSAVKFEWTKVAGAAGYKVWAKQGNDDPSVIASTTDNHVTVDVPSGVVIWFVEGDFVQCPPVFSAPSAFSVLKAPPACRTPDKPVARVVGQVQSGANFTVRWNSLVNVSHYTLEESTTPDFANPNKYTSKDTAKTFSYNVTAPTQYLYRVRGQSSCDDDAGPWSDIVGVIVMPPNVDPKSAKSSTEEGEQGNVVQTIFLPGVSTPLTFSAKTDKPWLTVTPSTGTLGPGGVTLTVTAAPGTLDLGTNTGTVQISYSGSGKTAHSDATVTSVPVSVSVVTPVSPVPRNTPQPDSLIIPGVAHTSGANNSNFQSDVRVANVSAQTMKYTLNFTPIAADGTQTGSSTTITIDPGATTALDDILSSFFGSGGASSGTLEIRPLTTSTSSSSYATSVSPSALGVNTVTVASSRTYNVAPSGGTLGQFIPAIPFSQFISKSTSSLTSILSLQQVASSAAYRTNIGLVEAAGQAASVLLRVFDDQNTLLAEIPVNLVAGSYVQDNYFAKNNLSFADGRVEIQVMSSTGKVTAYASTIDNSTNDPLLVSPVLKSSIAATHYVLPGIAALNTGLANWRSDVRIFNAGTTDAHATLTYVPMPGNPPAASPLTVTLKAGEVAAYDDILKSSFGMSTDSGGALSISTDQSSSLVTSARTYNLTSTGTLGQFIPGVTPNDAVGNSEGSLQLLQLEQSDRYRTNIGLAETAGQPATVEVTLFLPDSKVTPVYTVPLDANEFIQFPLSVFNAGTVYNGRVSVKVTSGSGRVTAYGSIIDAVTGDPTYVPQLK